MFTKSEKQIQACDMMNHHMHSMMYGGARSRKTATILRNIIIRAMRRPSKHLIVRHAFNHAKQSIVYDSMPKVIDGFFTEDGKPLPIGLNKSDWFYTVPVKGGGVSEIWIGGTADKDRIDKILGTEYSTIFFNECSEISWDAVTTLWSRLAENVGHKLKCYYDMNPVGKKHWTYQLFINKRDPETAEKLKIDSAYLQMNPLDDPSHLDPATIALYESMPKRKRQRFLLGEFLSDIEGALWTDLMTVQAVNRGRELDLSEDISKCEGIVKTVIAVDPAVTNNPDSDETGIIPCSIDVAHNGIVHDDMSLKASTQQWAQAVVNAYHQYEANEVVAEVNQGGDLVEDAIKNIDPSIKVVKVRASKGKFARAEPVAQLYEQGKVAHVKELPELETQMTEYVPATSKKSPDRLDALVWGLSHLCLRDKRPNRVYIGSV
jgi:phage terminase large subunit-like protein